MSTELSGNAKRKMKSAARFYAVQALYQMEVSGQTTDQHYPRISRSPLWRDL